MRVVMVGSFGLHPKGTMSARALPLARALVRRGHSVEMILPPWDAPADAGRAWEEAGVRMRCLALDGISQPRRSARLALRCIRAALESSPDILHCFKPIGYAGAAGMVAILAPGRRPAVVFDLDDLEGRAGWAAPASRSRVEAWLREAQEQWAMHHADALTVASTFLRERARAAGMPAARVHLVRNGCEPAEPAVGTSAWAEQRRQARARLGLAEGEPAVLWGTRPHESARPRVAAILARVAASRPDTRVLIAGVTGADSCVSRPQPSKNAATNKRMGLAADDHSFIRAPFVDGLASFDSLGWLAPADWRAAVLAADVGIVPLDDTPLNRARCPAKIPQMLAWGLPLVAEAVGEAPAYIEDGRTGWLVAAGDEAAFAAAILDLLAQPAQRAAMATEASRQAPARWSWDLQAGLTEAAYQAAQDGLHARNGTRMNADKRG